MYKNKEWFWWLNEEIRTEVARIITRANKFEWGENKLFEEYI